MEAMRVEFAGGSGVQWSGVEECVQDTYPTALTFDCICMLWVSVFVLLSAALSSSHRRESGRPLKRRGHTPTPAAQAFGRSTTPSKARLSSAVAAASPSTTRRSRSTTVRPCPCPRTHDVPHTDQGPTPRRALPVLPTSPLLFPPPPHVSRTQTHSQPRV